MDNKKKVLLICGSLNQTMMMHKISQHLVGVDCYFTHFYTTGIYRRLQKMGLLDFTMLAGMPRLLADQYISEQNLPVDNEGRSHDYDLVLTCTDLIVQDNIKGKPLILVQEGMTDPENLSFYLVKAFRKLGMPRWIASTSTTGLSDAYNAFCVASKGYRDFFVRKGVKKEKVYVTGIPNYDHAAGYLDNDFPHKGYVLVATSDIRENYGIDNRKKYIRKIAKVAAGRQVIFKLHPNENEERAKREIFSIIPDAKVFRLGDAHHMVANCDVLFTQYSTLAYTGLALKKEVYSYFDINELKRLLPEQNGGASAKNIAEVCQQFL